MRMRSCVLDANVKNLVALMIFFGDSGSCRGWFADRVQETYDWQVDSFLPKTDLDISLENR